MTVHRYQQRRRSQGHSAAAAIDGGRDDAACLPNMCGNEFLDGHGCAMGIGATRHGQPSTLRWQAVRPPHANDRRLGGPRAPAARFCRRPETSSGNTISQARVQPRPQLASADEVIVFMAVLAWIRLVFGVHLVTIALPGPQRVLFRAQRLSVLHDNSKSLQRHYGEGLKGTKVEGGGSLS